MHFFIFLDPSFLVIWELFYYFTITSGATQQKHPRSLHRRQHSGRLLQWGTRPDDQCVHPNVGRIRGVGVADHPRACAFRYAEHEGEGNCGLALPVADSARPQFPQRSKNARISASPKRFSGTARRIGRPQTTLDDIPANFLRHYPQYKKGAFNLTELARICDISRTTAYKYIGLLEG